MTYPGDLPKAAILTHAKVSLGKMQMIFLAFCLIFLAFRALTCFCVSGLWDL